MAIILHSEKYNDIKVDSKIIIGITGYEYDKFLKGIVGEDTYYIGNEFINNSAMVSGVIDRISDKKIDEYLLDLGLEKDFLGKYIKELSHSEQKLLKYLQMLTLNPEVIIIDEPYQDLDFESKKKITALIKKLVKKKTIIIGSSDTNIIYTECKKVLLLGKDKYLYDDVSILSNKNVLKWYHVDMPQILEFIRLAKDKKINLPYSKDVRDLIKDVYRNVSK